jgi:hypothetical protein
VSLSWTANFSWKLSRSQVAELQPDHVLQRAGDEEVLLLEAQLLAGLGLVVGVEHLGDGLGLHLFVTAP